jgi:hypothetical protein
MASKNSKRMATIATVAASLMMMGGAAFASPTSDTVIHVDGTTGLFPAPVSEALQLGRNTVATVDHQIRQVQENR